MCGDTMGLENEQAWRFVLAGASNMCGASGKYSNRLVYINYVCTCIIIYISIHD